VIYYSSQSALFIVAIIDNGVMYEVYFFQIDYYEIVI